MGLKYLRVYLPCQLAKVALDDSPVNVTALNQLNVGRVGDQRLRYDVTKVFLVGHELEKRAVKPDFIEIVAQ